MWKRKRNDDGDDDKEDLESNQEKQQHETRSGSRGDRRDCSRDRRDRSRDRDRREGEGGGGGSKGGPVEDFIKENRIDDKAAEVLLKLSPKFQEEVMSGENLRETTNPSAVLMSRIRKGRYQDEGKGGGNFIKKMKPTDMRRALQRRAMMNTTPRKTQHAMMVQEFLTGVFDDQARLLFLCLSPQMRTAVMEQGSLEGASNPSGALIERIKKIHQLWTSSGLKEGGRRAIRSLDELHAAPASYRERNDFVVHTVLSCELIRLLYCASGAACKAKSKRDESQVVFYEDDASPGTSYCVACWEVGDKEKEA